MADENFSIKPVPATYAPPLGLVAKKPQEKGKRAKLSQKPGMVEGQLVLPPIAGRIKKPPTEKSPGSLSRIWKAVKGVFVKEKPSKEAIVKAQVSTTASKIQKQIATDSGQARSGFLLTAAVGLMKISEDLLLTREEKKTKVKEKVLTAKAAVAQEDLYKTVPPFKIRVGQEETELKGYAIRSEGYNLSISEDQVIPTSFMLGGEDASHLTNCYVIKIGDRSTVIRTGVIDNDKKANEFYALLKKLYDETPETAPGIKPKIRVVSQQLNSPEREKKYIQNQHRLIAKLNARMHDADIGEIVHINTPTNRFYHFTKAVKKIPLLGRWLESQFLYGEKASKEQNIEAWGSYVKWVGEDLAAVLPSLKQHQFLKDKENVLKPLQDFAAASADSANEIYKLQRDIEGHVRSIGYLEQRIKNKHGDIKNPAKHKKELETSLKEARELLKTKLEDEFHRLSTLDSLLEQRLWILDGQIDISKQVQNTESLLKLHAEKKDLIGCKEKISLLKDVLADQLEVPDAKHLGRGRLEMSLQMLNNRLGVVSGINCKSGLDRTGFVFALRMALEQLNARISRPAEVTDMVQHWGSISREMNRRIANDGLDNFNEWLKAPDANRAETQLKARILLAIEFRKLVLDNLIRLGLPITGISTGVPGLKWHKGFQENLIPLNFIPPYVEVTSETGQPRKVAMVKYDHSGKPEGLTKPGHDLLTNLSSMRGS